MERTQSFTSTSEDKVDALVVAAIRDRVEEARVEGPQLAGEHHEALPRDEEIDTRVGDDGDMEADPPEAHRARHVTVRVQLAAR